jgi:hypothetical protein
MKQKTIESIILFIVIIIILSAGACSCTIAASDMPVSGTLTPETIYGVQPLDLVNNELSKKYFPALVKAYKSALEDPDKESLGRTEYPFQLFAIEPFEGGALLLAGYTIDQDYPDLYYMEGENILSQVTGAEYFSLNYTVFINHTISYGLMLDSFDKPSSLKKLSAVLQTAK